MQFVKPISPHQKKSLTKKIALLTAIGLTLFVATTAQSARTINDATITDAVQDEMFYDTVVPRNKIMVEANQGVVTLSGTTSNILEKERAARIAMTAKGVRSVVNNIAVKPDREISDQELEKNIKQALLNDPATESYEVIPSVENGMVTLKGTVDSWQEKNLAGTVTKNVRGVINVENTIDVDYKSERAEDEIFNEVSALISNDILLQRGLIQVKVNNNTVHLSGTVGSAAEKTKAESLAWVAGVSAVNSQKLKIRDWARDEDMKRSEYRNRSDEEIRKAVEAAMLYDPRVNSLNITTKVDNGRVTLHGVVDDLKEKRSAEQDARNTVGTLFVHNKIRVVPAPVVHDEILESDISRALSRDPYVERLDINVEVFGSEAILTGDVDSAYEKARADDVAARVDGIVSVKNHLDVVKPNDIYIYDPYVDEYYIYGYPWYDAPLKQSFQDDDLIENNIQDEIWWSPFVSAENVNVEVDDGVATLTGTVDSASEKFAARENALEGGATWVDNDLLVDPIP